MKKTVLCLIMLGLLLFSSCSDAKKTGETPTPATTTQEAKTEMKTDGNTTITENPFFSEFTTPFKVPPFDKIKTGHYLPAIKEGIKRRLAEIDAIVNNGEAPTFENTVEALEKSGSLLTSVDRVFGLLKESLSNDEMQKAATEIAPLMSKHQDSIFLNEKLFARFKAVDKQKDKLKLSVEQAKLLDKYYKKFVRSGANLDAQKKIKMQKINEELAVLKLKFSDNILKETNRFKLVIDKKEDLAGLPQSSIDAAAEAANEHKLAGKWVFTIHKPSLIPFLQYSGKRELREKMYKAYINKGNNNDELDNKKNLLRITQLRAEKAQLMGYKTHADFKLTENMAKNPETVIKFLMKVWKPALEMAKKEAKELLAVAQKEDKNFKLEGWDWWYYTEKLKKEKFDLDQEALRPYFKLENVRSGAFAVASKLFGIKFVERHDIPVYHKDVKVFEVQEASDSSHIGILYVDYFPRESKRGGAWMDAFRKQSNRDGKMVTPVISNCGNFSKPTADKPSLLTLEQASTLFHEFGHALHGLLSKCKYEELSGTSVALDYVEMHSQVMENWVTQPEVLKMYAKHYKTGEVIPQELLDKVKKASQFNQGFITLEYLAASLLDMKWQALTSTEGIDVNAFEKKVLTDELGMIPEIVSRYRSTFFNHIFSSMYSAGYYSYIWAEVLDSDAFGAFKEKGIFDKETAMAYRKIFLERGGTVDPMKLYKEFRGREPKVEPLLEKRGLK